jgi:uncharacterized membrane protein YbhN (UPF0104 family)
VTVLASIRTSRRVRLTLLAGTSAGPLTLFLVQTHPGRLWAGLHVLSPSAAATAVAATMCGVALGAVRWRWLLAAAGIDVPTGRLFAALAASAAVNNVVPARGGDVLRVESLRQQAQAPRLPVAGTLVAERILDGFVLALLTVVGALSAGMAGVFALVGAAVAVLAAVGAAVALRLGGKLRGRLASVAEGVAVFRSPRMLGGALAASGGIWLADVVLYGALARGFHLDASLGSILLLVGAGNLALAIPATAAGLGSFELVTLAGAHGIGAGGADLAAFVLAVHAVIVLPPTLVGAALSRVALPGAFRFRAEAPAAPCPES